jgi:hypothetical protein
VPLVRVTDEVEGIDEGGAFHRGRAFQQSGDRRIQVRMIL